jgi:hypothetical protein
MAKINGRNGYIGKYKVEIFGSRFQSSFDTDDIEIVKEAFRKKEVLEIIQPNNKVIMYNFSNVIMMGVKEK